MAKRVAPGKQKPGKSFRKVTYSLPERLVEEMDRRSAGRERGRSQMVAEALAFYFAAQDRRALGVLYGEAAEDPDFLADNEAIQEDFAALDREADEDPR